MKYINIRKRKIPEVTCYPRDLPDSFENYLKNVYQFPITGRGFVSPFTELIIPITDRIPIGTAISQRIVESQIGGPEIRTPHTYVAVAALRIAFITEYPT